MDRTRTLRHRLTTLTFDSEGLEYDEGGLPRATILLAPGEWVRSPGPNSSLVPGPATVSLTQYPDGSLGMVVYPS